MTREEATQKLSEVYEPVAGELNAYSVVKWLERAGLIKFDEPQDTLKHKLVGCTVTFISRHRGEASLGSLDLNGAGIVLNYIEQLGFKIVKASE